MIIDSFYENQISKTNEVGNSLLSGLFASKNVENRKLVNISNGLKKLAKQVERYRNEKAKLQTLQIAICHAELEEKRFDEFEDFCKDAMTSMSKIEKILNHHLKYNAGHILSKVDLEEMERGKFIESLDNKLAASCEEATKSSAVEGTGSENKLKQFQERLTSIQQIEKTLEKIIKLANDAGKNVDRIQNETISNSAQLLDFVTYFSIEKSLTSNSSSSNSNHNNNHHDE